MKDDNIMKGKLFKSAWRHDDVKICERDEEQEKSYIAS